MTEIMRTLSAILILFVYLPWSLVTMLFSRIESLLEEGLLFLAGERS